MKDEQEVTSRVMSMKDKRELAKLLYVSGACGTQKETAERVGVSEVTISKWSNADAWDEQKRSLLTIRHNQLSRMYLLLEYYVNKVENRVKEFKAIQDDPTIKQEVKDKALDISTKDTDVIIKLTGAVKNLEIELSVAEVVDVFMKYNDHLRKMAPEKIKEAVELQDSYIKTLI